MTERRHSRRRWLTSCAGATAALVGLSGCTGDSDDDGETSPDGGDETDDGGEDEETGGSDEETSDEEEETGADAWWPMENYDAANSRVTDDRSPDAVSEQWHLEFDSQPSNPIVGHGNVYIQDAELTQYAFDLESGEVEWRREHELEYGHINDLVAAPVLTEDTVYFLANELEALDPHTGDVQWSVEVDAHNPDYGRIKRTDDGLFVTVGDNLYGIDPEAQEIVWEKKMPKHRDMVVTDDGIVVVTRVGGPIERRFEIHGVEAETGEERWSYKPDDHSDEGRGLTLYDGTVYTHYGRTDLLAIDPDSGAVDVAAEYPWRHRSVAPIIIDGVAYTVGVGGMIALDLQTGEQPEGWDPDDGGSERSGFRPVAMADTIQAGEHYRGDPWFDLDRETGERRWEFDVAEPYDTDTAQGVTMDGCAATSDYIVLMYHSGSFEGITVISPE